MSGNTKDFKVKNGIKPTAYHEAVGTVVSGTSGYSLGNASYDSVSLSVTSQIGTPTGIFFKPDGTKVFIVDLTGQDISEYSLSTAWDLTTASYVTAFSISSQDTNPWGIFFKPDGTIMYLMGRINDTVFQYTLSTAWDISTASYASKSFSVTSQDTLPNDLFLKSDGTKLYVLGGTNDTMYQYTLSTAYDISTASYDSVSFSLASQSTSPTGVFFHPDGTSFYVVAFNRVVYKYDLSTTWDLSTASYSGTSATWSDPTDNATYQLFFKSDGTKMYIVGGNTDSVYQFSTVLNTNTLDLSTGSVFELTPTSDVQINLSNPAASGTVSQATLLLDNNQAAYDISKKSLLSTYTIFGAAEAIYFKPDGTKFYAVAISPETVYEYTLFTPWDVTTASQTGTKTFTEETSTYALTFSSDGLHMYFAGAATDRVYQYNLSTAWQVSTASSANKDKSVAQEGQNPTDVAFSNDGTKMYAVMSSTVYQYTLSTAWDVSTASYDSKSYRGNGFQNGLFFTSDGTQMFGLLNYMVTKYSLSTAWDISTASIVDGPYSYNDEGTSNDGLYIGDNGYKLYIANNTTDNILEYNLYVSPTITYPTNITWPSGTAPKSPSLGDTDVLTFTTRDGGTTYSAALAIDGAS